MKKDTMNQNAMIAIVIGAILVIAGGYQAFNPVLAVSAHDDRADVQRMLATTTFTMEHTPRVPPCYPTGDEFGYGDVDDDGYVTNDDSMYVARYFSYGEEYYPLTDDQMIRTDVNLADGITLADALLIGKYATYAEGYDTFPACNLPSAAQIDDYTDTLTTGETTYHPEDTIHLTAWGENIGEQVWSGKVTFTVTQPDGEVYTEFDSLDITVNAGSSESVLNSFESPSDAATGTWTIQSKWIDADGNVHAMSTIDLGTETIWGYDINVFGALIALIGLLIVGYGFAKRKS